MKRAAAQSLGSLGRHRLAALQSLAKRGRETCHSGFLEGEAGKAEGFQLRWHRQVQQAMNSCQALELSISFHSHTIRSKFCRNARF